MIQWINVERVDAELVGIVAELSRGHALRLDQSSRAAVSCPTCGVKVGDHCLSDGTHETRVLVYALAVVRLHDVMLVGAGDVHSSGVAELSVEKRKGN